MKFLKKLSLFFYIMTVSQLLLPLNSSFALQQTDSSAYYFSLLRSPQNSNDLFSAFRFFNARKEQSLLQNDTLRAVLNLRYLAIIQNEIGFVTESETSAIEALRLVDHLPMTKESVEAKIGIYNHLGKLYRGLSEFDTALDYYNKALQNVQTSTQKNIVLNNRALVYEEQGQFELAEAEFSKAYTLALKSEDKRELARTLDNLGFVQSKTGITDALPNMLKALSIREERNDSPGIYASYRHLATYYTDINNKTEAKAYAQKALDKARSINSLSYIKDALDLLLGLEDNKNIIEFKRINDSITLAKQHSMNAYASMKYAYDKQEKLAKENELEKEVQKNLKLLYLALSLLISITAIALVFILRAKYNREKLQQVYVTETRISKKVHDEVANDVYHVITRIQGASSNEDVLDELESIYNRTRDISKENSAINVSDNFNELVHDMLLSYKNDEVNIVTRSLCKINWDAVQDLKKTALYRVLQELMTNMRKHSKASWVVISFEQKDHKININYKDNGLGCNLKKNNGLVNAENRINSIKGIITFETQVNKGFNVKISI
ncbi:tetratricopeptide repeat-containing sensor histidine kinase [Flavobacteriaceae bacterium LMO-SS05]